MNITRFPPNTLPPVTGALTWTPTYSVAGGGSFGTLTTNQAFWWPAGDEWTGIYVRAVGTITGTVTRINVGNLPRAASTAWGQLPLVVATKNNGDKAGAAIVNTSNQIIVRTHDGSNWTVGTPRGFQLFGVYPNA